MHRLKILIQMVLQVWIISNHSIDFSYLNVLQKIKEKSAVRLGANILNS